MAFMLLVVGALWRRAWRSRVARMGGTPYLCFRFEGYNCAVPTRLVRAVFPCPSTEVLELNAGPGGLTLVKWKGRELPTVDWRSPAARASSRSPRGVVLAAGGSSAALILDGAPRPIKVDTARIGPLPQGLAQDMPRFLVGQVTVQNETFYVLEF